MPTELADPLELRMVDLINAERDEAGLAPVHVEVHLNHAAQGHSDWMADEQTLSHAGAGDSTPADRAGDSEFPMEGGSWQLTENVAYRSLRGPVNDSDVGHLHDALMDSPEHRANILDPDADYVGIGIATGQMAGGGGMHDVVFVTQKFGSTTLPVEVQEEMDGQTVITQYLEGAPVEGTSVPAPGEGDDDTAPDPDDDDDGSPDDPEEDPQTDSGAGGACFVATAAYGDRLHPDVVALRSLRDQVLVRHGLGRAFVRLYWRVGPRLARQVAHDRISGRMARLCLYPCAWAASAILRSQDARRSIVLVGVWRSGN